MLKLSIIAKDKILYQGDVSSVVVPTQMGIIEVLPSHVQLVSALASGDLVIKTDPSNSSGQEREQKWKINGGVLEVRSKSEVVILADRIE